MPSTATRRRSRTATGWPRDRAHGGLDHDAYPRALNPARVARMPVVAEAGGAVDAHARQRHALSTPTISPKADGAALVLLATPQACARLGLQPRARWVASASLGHAPETPPVAAALAAQQVLGVQPQRCSCLA